MRRISTSKGCRSFKSVERGLRPNASETSLPAPANFPLGEDQDSSTMLFVLTLSINHFLTAGVGQAVAESVDCIEGKNRPGDEQPHHRQRQAQQHFKFSASPGPHQ